MTAACFSNHQYEDIAAARCISNLLATGFGRLAVDLYWDYNRRVWSFCPVQIPAALPSSAILTTSISVPSVSLATGSNYVTGINATAAGGVNGVTRSHLTSTSTAQMSKEAMVKARQFVSSSSSYISSLTSATRASNTIVTSSMQANLSSATTTSGFVAVPTAAPGLGNEVLITLGPYTCSTSFTLSSFISLLSDYALKTDDTLDAVINYITFNVHAAASASNPTAPAPAPPNNALPTANETIGSLAYAGLASYLYTYADLRAQRQDVNSTWLKPSIFPGPSTGYYTFQSTSQGLVSVPDGWPTAYFLLYNARRLLIELGTIDAQMANYSTTATDSYIFPSNYLLNPANVTLSQNGTVTTGCLYLANNTNPNTINASWAIATADSSLSASLSAAAPFYNQSLPSITNLTACGISFLLNETYSNTTADISIAPYRDLAYSSVWSWAPGQPARGTNDSQVRCAGFPLATAGRWAVLDCQEHHPAACRADARPHVWRIASQRGTYEAVDDNCPSGFRFAVPRTALESRYLLEAVRAQALAGGDGVVWVNFNSLDVPDCWVTGVNTTCPYQGTGVDLEYRRITVPAVAAVVVLVVALLTIVVKINANRQNSRRKRVGEDGWDYEGVPS